MHTIPHLTYPRCRAVWPLLCLSLLLSSCGRTSEGELRQEAATMRYLALGDSYTIGESVATTDRWPVQLAARLQAQGLRLAAPEIIARTGWTTDALLAALAQQPPQGPFALVSLLIGVNNQYRGRDSEAYRLQFRELLQMAIAYAGGHPERVLVLSIPDWGVTPFAAPLQRDAIAAAVDQFNAVNAAETRRAGAHYVDITPVSRQAPQDPTLIAHDGLHPSGRMYTQWVELALPVALQVLGQAVQP